MPYRLLPSSHVEGIGGIDIGVVVVVTVVVVVVLSLEVFPHDFCPDTDLKSNLLTIQFQSISMLSNNM